MEQDKQLEQIAKQLQKLAESQAKIESILELILPSKSLVPNPKNKAKMDMQLQILTKNRTKQSRASQKS